VTAIYFLVAKHTEAADILTRFTGTHFVGWMPDTRAEVWPEAWERMMQHPIIGHGPLYLAERGIKLWYWPHDLYLYVGNCYGFVGLGAFLWILWTLWRMSTPQTDRLNHPEFAKALQLVTRVQLAIFLVDEIKIEYLRNATYQFQVWVFFSMLAATSMIATRAPAGSLAPAVRPPAGAPFPARA
jgi:O-antigen ligase